MDEFEEFCENGIDPIWICSKSKEIHFNPSWCYNHNEFGCEYKGEENE